MKHIRRALKYFIQVTILFGVIIGALMALKLVSTDVNVAFRNGWKSIGFIAGAFFGISFLYPFFGYGKRSVRAKGDPAEYREAIDRAMAERGYVLESEKEGELKYRLSSGVARVARLWEDTVTITPFLGGFQAEGLMRDLARVVMSLERNINTND